MKRKQSAQVLDFNKLCLTGKTYNDTYGNYLQFFNQAGPGNTVINVPKCWVPLLWYLGCEIGSCLHRFEHCRFVPNRYHIVGLLESTPDPRQMVEVFCTMRPELVDALWKVDNQWGKVTRCKPLKGEIIITNSNSFNRVEIRNFIHKVSQYKTKHKKCVITNCSADKPYPSYVHKEIKKRYPGHELLIISGVTGIVPEQYFKQMPIYDSGLPNFWNIKKLSADYFRKNQYDEIVVFTEFNQYALNEVLMQFCAESVIWFPFPYGHFKDYMIDDKFMKGYKK